MQSFTKIEDGRSEVVWHLKIYPITRAEKAQYCSQLVGGAWNSSILSLLFNATNKTLLLIYAWKKRVQPNNSTWFQNYWIEKERKLRPTFWSIKLKFKKPHIWQINLLYRAAHKRIICLFGLLAISLFASIKNWFAEFLFFMKFTLLTSGAFVDFN